MYRQVFPGSWSRLLRETEVLLTKQPHTALLTVVFGVREPELRRLKPFPTAVAARLNHLLFQTKRWLIKTTGA